MFWFLRGSGHLGEFVKNGNLSQKSFFCQKKKKKIIDKIFFDILSRFLAVKGVEATYTKILAENFNTLFFLQ